MKKRVEVARRRAQEYPLMGSRHGIFVLLIVLMGVAHSQSFSEAAEAKPRFVIGEREFLLDGKPFVIRCGEMHFARIPREYWEHRLRMAKALGLNAVCAYLFWNVHEWEEGKFDWSGMADAAEFCRLAEKAGLWIIVRPGPYACAEWEMGGLPWWLLKKGQIDLRSKDPAFLEPAVRYLKEVARVLGPLQITRGGPILMFQVENEYGSYGRDAEYMGLLRQAFLDSGIDVPLFACNPAGAIGNGYRPDLFQVVNFGRGGAQEAFKKLSEFQKTGPLMNGEYYPAWFDMWGRPHHTGDLEGIIVDLDDMLKNRHSFSIYMAHGGTSFGLWSGADRPFSPDTSSYDYEAPISEAGWVTEKFRRIREVFARHLLPGESLPEPPPPNSVIAIPEFALAETAPIFANLPSPKGEATPPTMEDLDQSRGCMVYRTTLPPGPAGTLSVREVHDFAWVFLDGEKAGVMDRRGRRYRLPIPARSKPVQLDLLVEAMGRVNFGREVADRKGIHAPVEFIQADGAATEMKGWEIYSLPLDEAELASLKFADGPAAGPAFWRATFEVATPGDTFLDVRSWGKGVVWVNGHCLGRFWNIGPTQTMFLPGPWLKPGRNEIVVLDLLGPADPKIAGLEKPILDQLRLDLDFARRARAGGAFATQGLAPAATGKFNADIEWQEALFAKAEAGRYLALEVLNALDGQAMAAIAELDATDPHGNPLSKSDWKIHWVDSEEITTAPGDAENVLDGQPATCWQTQSGDQAPGFPHRIVIDMSRTQTIGGIRYLPRAGAANERGRIGDYRVFVSTQPFGLSSAP